MIIIDTLILLFLIIIPVRDCELGDWQEGECSVSCGPGQRVLTRVEIIEEINGGIPCSGDLSKTESCNLKECPGIARHV